ncbi:MAG: DUF202 domain-containing protein [Bacteroidia bacterium]
MFENRGIFENKDEIILRDYLALERTRLANERTLLAYLRTALYFIVGGIALVQLEDFEKLKWLGVVALGLSVVIFIWGVFRFYRMKKRLEAYYNDTRSSENQLHS